MQTMNDDSTVTRRTLLAAASAMSIGGVALYACAPAAGAIRIKVYKDAGCDCCKLWMARLESEGFVATVEDRTDLQTVKMQLGVPDDLASCHTATVDRFVIEGHVPAADIKRLLSEKPAARGLAVPGMPIGSPGMEVEGRPAEPYTVWLFEDSTNRKPFALHGA